MKLYTAHLQALQGFYASNVYVLAPDILQAVQRALQGIKSHVAEQIHDYGGFFVLNCSQPDEPGHAEELADFYRRVEIELRRKLYEIPEGVIVKVRS
jgi:hypothetical protein